MNDHLILTPQDNTKTDYMIEQTYEKGRSEYNRLYIPNEGIDADNNLIHYMPYGSIALKDKIVVDKKNIFLENGYLVKPGIVVEKYYVSKKQDGLFVGDEKYFKVIISNIKEVEPNSLVIVIADQGYRFNLQQKEYFFVQEDKILLVINNNGINAGPSNMLLEQPKPEIIGMTLNDPNKGSYNGTTYYFSDALYDVTIKNERYSVVSKKDLKLYN